MGDSELSRREFLDRVGAASLIAALPGSLPVSAAAHVNPSDWDLSWVTLLKDASDRAVVDAPGTSDFPLQLATRFLDNCDAAYGVGKHSARVVVNLRTRGIALGMTDALWERFSLGTEYDIKERSGTPPPIAIHNPFLNVPTGSTASLGAINDLVARKAILLICDFAMGHLSERLATKAALKPEAVHQALRAGLVPGAYAVPSGIFGLARSQNAGCAFISGAGA